MMGPWTGGIAIIQSPELAVGDLCMWMGKPSEYSGLSRRVIYQCVEKKRRDEPSKELVYRYRVAFDFENPMGSSLDLTNLTSSRDMKRMSLLDVATLRLHFDCFIKEWAQAQGAGDPDDVR